MINIDPEKRPPVEQLLGKNIFKDFDLVAKKAILNGRFACSNPKLLKNSFVQSFQVIDNKDENKK